jgi:hypothetical protein
MAGDVLDQLALVVDDVVQFSQAFDIFLGGFNGHGTVLSCRCSPFYFGYFDEKCKPI